MVALATQVKRRRGTTAQNDAFTGAEGEIVVDTQRHELRVHDGVTRGGFKIGGDKANVGLDNLTSAGKEVVAHNAMPSRRAIDLTLGASGSAYTAPADGTVLLVKSGNTGQYVTIDCSRNKAYFNYSTASQACSLSLQVSKGDSFVVWYDASGATDRFVFIYANGAE